MQTPDHIDRAAEVAHKAWIERCGVTAPTRDHVDVFIRALDAAGRLVSPEHDAAVAAKAADRVLAVILSDLDTMRGAHAEAKTWDDALSFVRGYLSGAAILQRLANAEGQTNE